MRCMFTGLATMLVIVCIGLVSSGCGQKVEPAAPASSIETNAEIKEIRLTGKVNKTNVPRMSGFASAGPALLGSANGKYQDFFVFLIDQWTWDIEAALVKAGLKYDAFSKKAKSGHPISIMIEWEDSGEKKRAAYPSFFDQQVTVDGKESVRTWEPKLVFHGSAAVKKLKTGCIACTHYCPGGISGNALTDEPPVLRANWDRLPAPGTVFTATIRF